jgi:hypothetical protein
MIDTRVMFIYMKTYCVDTIEDEKTPVAEIADKLLEFVDSSKNEIKAQDLHDIILGTMRSEKVDRVLALIDSLSTKRPELKQGFFDIKFAALSKKGDASALISEAVRYEKEFGRDGFSMAALLHFYLMDGYSKHAKEIKELMVAMKPIVEG